MPDTTATDTLLPRALTEREAARYIGMSESFLRISRMNGDRANRTPGPSWFKIGKAIRYDIRELDAWLERHKVSRPLPTA